MATNVFTSRFTARQVETALERAMTAVQSINGQQAGGGGDVFMEELHMQKGEPASLEEARVRYAASPSGTDVPVGPWSEMPPQVRPGYCLWTKTTLVFNTGDPVEFYSVARMGADSTPEVCVTLALPVSGWAELEQTVPVPQMTDSAGVTVAPAPESEENYRSYLESGVRCVSQGAGTLTFRCGQVPQRELTVNVRIDGVAAPAEEQRVSKTAVLLKDGWFSGRQTLAFSEITAGVIVAVEAAEESREEYTRCGITCTAQEAGTITFTCTEVPTIDLTVAVNMIV